MTNDNPKPSRLALAADIVAAYLGNNSLPLSDVPGLIRDVHAALGGFSSAVPASAPSEKPAPAVPIRRSLTPDYIVSLEDGRHYKSLKRHLAVNGLTPMTYRQKWGLPLDYPMVAPNYAKRRSELARAIGLGRRKREVAAPTPKPKRGGGGSRSR